MSVLQSIIGAITGSSGAAPILTGTRVLELDAFTYAGSGPWLDLSPTGESMTLANGVFFDTNKFSMNGGYIYNTGNAVFSTMTNPTCAAWIYWNGLPDGSDHSIISGQTWAFRIDSATTMNFVKYSVLDQIVNVPSFQTGQWYHVVAAMDAAETRYYVNGVKVATYGNIQSYNPTNNVINIGANNNIDGYIAKAQVYNFPLSDTAVKGLYNSECAQFSLSPVAVPTVFNANVWGLWDPLTYGGSGNLLDSSGNNRPFVLNNAGGSISYNANNRGKFISSAANGGDNFALSNDLRSGNYTFFYAGKLTGTRNKRIWTGIGNNWLLGPWMGTTNDFYSEGWIYPPTGPIAESDVQTTWKIHTGSVNTPGNVYSYYNNGVKQTTNNYGLQGPNGLYVFACGPYPDEYSAAQVGIFVIWDKVLTDAEVLEAYEYYRTRYGI